MKQFRNSEFSISRNTFLLLFAMLVLVLILMPFLATFNDILTRIVINLRGYTLIREYVVPFEVRMVAVILTFLGQDVGVTKEYVVLGNTEPFVAEIIWNCIGWQSILFFIITAYIGLQGDRYTAISKLKAFLIGAFGTFLINILRIVVVVLVAYRFGGLAGTVVHDYGSLLAVIGWLFFFWWFTYAYVLEEKLSSKFKVQS